MESPLDRLLALEAVIAARTAAAAPDQSYVAQLVAAGLPKIAQKLGEEAVETVVAALAEPDERLVSEAADLVFHLTMLLHQRRLGWRDIAAELERRSR